MDDTTFRISVPGFLPCPRVSLSNKPLYPCGHRIPTNFILFSIVDKGHCAKISIAPDVILACTLLMVVSHEKER
jgi:hypothetical protein